jgi:hypothetical protein
MVSLNLVLTSRLSVQFLTVVAFAAAWMQPTDVAAQDAPRDDSSREFRSESRDDESETREKSREYGESGSRARFSGRASERRSYFNDGQRGAPQFFSEGEFVSPPVSEGFVFVNGEFLPRPYTFRSDGKLTFINDVLITDELVDFGLASESDDGDEDPGRSSRRRRAGIQQTYAEFLNARFPENRKVLVAFSGQSPTLLSTTAGGNDLLSVLVSDVHRSDLLPRLLNFAGSSAVASQWSGWIKSYQPSGEFLTAAQPIVDRIDATLNENQSRHAAMRRLDSFAYPLTIVGMFMSVFAIGHLMSNPPNGGKTPDEIEMSPEVVQIVTRSLVLVVALSLLDLIWTLLASQAGTMRELNPVGGRLIEDPATLIVFKVAMTGLAAGLIFKLRYYRRAQLASWWACLILTLLTVRWLTFNSMLA